MRSSSIIGPKGRLTVPKEVRTRLGLKAGDSVEFEIEGNDVVIRRAQREENPFAKYAGALPAFPGGIEEINAWIRELRDDESQN